MMMDRTLRVLEFTRIREMLPEGAQTENGRERCMALVPTDSLFDIEEAQQETEEATVILQYVGGHPLTEFPDARGALQICEKGGTLSPRMLLDVAGLLRSSRAARDALVTERENTPRLRGKAETLVEVGLGYIKLGQASTTLSGGEAQRVKLATELSRVSTGQTIYILDEPTTGLHAADVHKLIQVLQLLVDAGNTVVVIEHNLDVIKTADYIIDLGPEGGDQGGYVIATGTPEEVVENPASFTGIYLKPMLQRE